MAINWADIQKKYKGKWVALKNDEETVVGSGSSAKEAWQEAQNKGYEKPIMFRVPTEVMPYIGSAWV